MNHFADNVHGSKAFLIRVYILSTIKSKFNKFDTITVLVLLCVNVFVCVSVFHSLTRDLFFTLCGLSFDEQDFLILIKLSSQICALCPVLLCPVQKLFPTPKSQR